VSPELIVCLAVTYLLATSLLPPVLSLLSRGRLVRGNYQGQMIPVGAGILLPLSMLPALALWMAVTPPADPSFAVAGPELLLVMGMALLGFVDDAAGDTEARGLRGHLRALTSGQLTTGAVKAIYGGVLGVSVALILPEKSLLRVGMAAGLIALGANALNLFDLRPGRALKAFFLGYSSLVLATRSGGGPLLLALPAAAALMPHDLAARAMMGDVGANVLGGLLGLFAATHLKPAGQLSALLLLVGLHIYTEQRSLSELIADVPLLHWLDNWGRR
jgi:UDP-GlcNAc:undecaprenyl-phosphate GlcNAc-1-phosphate transferase